jgi:regulator of replication initiation timing
MDSAQRDFEKALNSSKKGICEEIRNVGLDRIDPGRDRTEQFYLRPPTSVDELSEHVMAIVAMTRPAYLALKSQANNHGEVTLELKHLRRILGETIEGLYDPATSTRLREKFTMISNEHIPRCVEDKFHMRGGEIQN